MVINIFPLFLKDEAGGAGVFTNLALSLDAEPDIEVDTEDIVITADPDISVVADPDISVESD